MFSSDNPSIRAQPRNKYSALSSACNNDCVKKGNKSKVSLSVLLCGEQKHLQHTQTAVRAAVPSNNNQANLYWPLSNNSEFIFLNKQQMLAEN